jgi:hypothetical protein
MILYELITLVTEDLMDGVEYFSVIGFKNFEDILI